jgi:hypothetical protein
MAAVILTGLAASKNIIDDIVEKFDDPVPEEEKVYNPDERD